MLRIWNRCFFRHFLVIFIYFQNFLLRSIAHFLIGYIYLDSVFWVIYIFRILILYQIYTRQRFYSTLWTSSSMRWMCLFLYRNIQVLLCPVCQFWVLIFKWMKFFSKKSLLTTIPYICYLYFLYHFLHFRFYNEVFDPLKVRFSAGQYRWL